MKKLLFLLLVVQSMFSQTPPFRNETGVGAGFSGAMNSSSVLEARSTTKGFLLPRMTESQRDAISSPATSLMIYQTDGDAGYYYYNGTSWVSFGSGGTTSGVETVNGESPDGGGNVVVNRQSVYDQGNDYATAYDSSVLAGSGYSDASYFNIPSLGDGLGLYYDYSVITATEDDGTIHSINDTKTLQAGQAYIVNEIFKTNPDGSGERTVFNVLSPDSGSQGVRIEAEQTDTSSAMVGITNFNVLTNKQETIITRPAVSGDDTKVTYQTPETIEPGVEATITKAAPEVAGDYFEPIIFEVGGTDYTADATGRVVLPSGGGGGGVTEVTGTDGVTIASGTTTPVVGLGNITPDSVAATGTVSGSNLSGTNTGDQTSISGITGTKAEFDTAVTDGNFLYVGDVTQYTDSNARAAVVQNSMTASTTLSPSVTAVNTAIGSMVRTVLRDEASHTNTSTSENVVFTGAVDLKTDQELNLLLRANKDNTNAAWTIRAYINNVNTLNGSETQIFRYNGTNTVTKIYKAIRTITINASGTLTAMNGNLSSLSDDSVGNSAWTTRASATGTHYLIITLQNTSSSDTTSIDYVRLTSDK